MTDLDEPQRYRPIGWREAMEEDPPLPQPRPLGVSVLAALDLLGALSVLAFLIYTGLNTGHSDENAGIALSPLALLWLEAVTGTAASVGLWTLREWGRLLAIGRSVGFITVVLAWKISDAVTGGLLLQILISAAIITYLLQPKVREAFRL